jgi:hypothetical protein
MTNSFSIEGDETDWIVFSKTVAGHPPILIRSRTSNPDLRAFAEANVLTRLRCELPPEQRTENGMPTSTAELDAFEDKLIDGLKERSAQTYLIAVVTGDGNRDFFWAGADGAAIRDVVRAVPDNPSFKLGFADVGAEAKPVFLNGLTVPAEALQRAKAEAAKSGGGFVSRLFGGTS